ncbi:hypothetical protein Hanom_Chr09g00824411 [Helianthus anomalus]
MNLDFNTLKSNVFDVTKVETVKIFGLKFPRMNRNLHRNHSLSLHDSPIQDIHHSCMSGYRACLGV